MVPANDRDLTPEIRGVTDDRPGTGLFSWDRPPMLPKEKIKLLSGNAQKLFRL
jgi:hypothetical protein